MGFASGKAGCFDLVTGMAIKEYGVDDPMSDVTHLMSVKDNSALLVAHSQFRKVQSEEGRVEMLQKTPIRLYDVESQKLVCSYLIPDLTVQSVNHLSVTNTFLVLSTG